MLDPAILESLHIPFPPERPALVEDQVLRSAAAEQAARIGRRLADGFDAAADSWIATMERARRSVESATIESESPADLQTLSATIDDFETVAEMRARASSWISDPGRCSKLLLLHRLFPKAGGHLSGRCSSCLVAERRWDAARWAIKAYAWRFDGVRRHSARRER